MPADGMRATGSPEPRFGTPVSARCEVYPIFENWKDRCFDRLEADRLNPPYPRGRDDDCKRLLTSTRKYLGFVSKSAARFCPPLRLRCMSGDSYDGRAVWLIKTFILPRTLGPRA